MGRPCPASPIAQKCTNIRTLKGDNNDKHGTEGNEKGKREKEKKKKKDKTLEMHSHNRQMGV